MHSSSGSPRSITRLAIAAAASLLLALGGASAAWAKSYNVEGGLSCIGNLTTYGTFRAHNSGAASIKTTSFTAISKDGVNFGLRNRDGVQVTKSTRVKKADLNTAKSFKTSRDRTTIPAGSYALNARHITSSTGCGWPTPSWKGSLNL